jgi:hypothetical protein
MRETQDFVLVGFVVGIERNKDFLERDVVGAGFPSWPQLAGP